MALVDVLYFCYNVTTIPIRPQRFDFTLKISSTSEACGRIENRMMDRYRNEFDAAS